MSMFSSRFSIITICLNAAATIEWAPNNVLSQPLPPVEHAEYIVVDGGSTDGAEPVLVAV